MAGKLTDRLEAVEAELIGVRKRLDKLYSALETSELTLDVLSPRIVSLRGARGSVGRLASGRLCSA